MYSGLQPIYVKILRIEFETTFLVWSFFFKVSQDIQNGLEIDQKDHPRSESAAMFLTQEDIEDDAILTSGTVDRNIHSRQEEENTFPGVFSLCWQLARFLQAMSENVASGAVLASLIKYIKKVSCEKYSAV